jgi:riboflavin synthase
VFTGLVEQTGVLRARAPRGPNARLVVGASLGTLELGESIAVDGVCLTVDALAEGAFEADASAETLAKTTLGRLAIGAKVNLERAAQLGQRMGGHIVSGHVDGVGTVTERVAVGGAVQMTIQAPADLLRFLAPKGSVCVSGVSLTVNTVAGDLFSLMLIPHTLGKTSLDGLKPGDPVNLEADVVARYVARLIEVKDLSPEEVHASWLARLERAGLL